MSEDKMYWSPAINKPTVETLQGISKDLGFDISEKQMKVYQDVLEDWLEACREIDELPEPSLPVKYARTPGYRPSLEENTHNAWYYKTGIKGAADGILKGKKIALKDSVAVAGVPMMVGSRLMEGYTPEFDATIVTRILDAGGELIGKTVCEDLCASGGSCTSAFGPVYNPINKEHTAGGSSSGSAVVVALKEADMATGGDQGGSIRIPSSYCGLVGLKPTFGLVPYTGICGREPTMDHVGPMARTVKDCALLLQAIAGYDDGLDSKQQLNTKGLAYSELVTGDVKDIKIGLLTEGFVACDDGVQSIVRQAVLDCFSANMIDDVSIPLHKKASSIRKVCCLQGGYRTLIEHGGFGTGHKGFYPTSMMDHMWRAVKSRPDDLSSDMKAMCLYGELLNRTNGSKYYAKSRNLTRLLDEAYNEALEKNDVLIMPTMPTTAPKLPTVKDMADNFMKHTWGDLKIDNTVPFNSTGHPALSINAGFLGGLPVGMMIVGKHYDEVTVLNVAQAVENSSTTS